MSLDDAVRYLRADPASVDLVRDAYIDRDVRDGAARFANSAEWAEVQRLLAGRIDGATVVDVGSGTGISTAAFAAAGAGRVIAVEPDPSDEVGRGAMARIGLPPSVEIVDALGEGLPINDDTADIVYCRQVLHHAQDLDAMVLEMTRVLRPGGVLLACREHVVDDDNQLRTFLAAHPVNRLAGGENAFRLDRYLRAIERAGMRSVRVLGPWDSVINAFPAVRSEDELDRYAADALARRLGKAGRIIAALPPVTWLAWRRIRRPLPGRMYTFLAVKDAAA